MAGKRAFPKAKSDNAFGQTRRPTKMFRAGLYAGVSTNGQQTLVMQNRALRECAARRGWTIAHASAGDWLRSGAARSPRETAGGRTPPRTRCRARMAIGPLGPAGNGPADNTPGTGASRSGLCIAERGPRSDHACWTSDGRTVSHIAQFERQILRERTRTGLAHSRQNGKRLGRPATGVRHPAEIRRLHRAGVSKAEIARRPGVGRTSVRRIFGLTCSARNRVRLLYAGLPKGHDASRVAGLLRILSGVRYVDFRVLTTLGGAPIRRPRRRAQRVHARRESTRPVTAIPIGTAKDGSGTPANS